MLRNIGRLRAGGSRYDGPTYSSYPLSSDYGPARFYPVGSIVTGTNVTRSTDGAQFTVGASTGNLTMGGNPYVPVVVGETVAVWFRAVSGTPTTAQIRFINSSGSNVALAQNMSLSNGYYYIETVVPANAAFCNFFCTNTGGSDVVIGAPALAVQGATARSNGSEGNLWLTTTAGKASGSGTAATLNTDRTVTMPSGAVQYARCDLNVGTGKNIVVAIKVSSNDVKSMTFLLQSSGQLFYLENWGSGWWGKRIAVAGTDTSVYGQFQVDNNTSTYYTAGTVTVETAYAYEGTDYPGAIPAGEVAGDAYDRSEVVVQQGPGQINFFLAGSNPDTAKYIRWQVRQYTGAPGSGAGWTLERIHEVTRTGDQAFMVGDNLTDVGEHLLAWREANSDFIGGDTHGYQIGLTATLTIDGVPQSIDGETDFRCTTAVFTMTSELYRFGTSTKIMTATQTLTFADGKLTYTPEVTNVSGGALDIVRSYAMWSFARRFNNATSGTTNQIFTAYTNTAGGSGAATGSGNIPATFDSTADSWTLTGSNGLTATFAITSGWGANGDSWLQSASNSNKLYFSPTGYFADAGPGYSFADTDTVSVTAEYTLDTAN